MGKLVVLIILVFTVSLAYAVGTRLTREATAVVVGVVCGVAASIPMSLLILLVVNRRRDAPVGDAQALQRTTGYQSYPPVVVIQGGARQEPAGPFGAQQFYPHPAEAPARTARDFRIIGQDNE